MTHQSPQREFAVEVVKQLRDAGFQAYWAGGCVRDGLLGLAPKDYDVATDARPEQIRAVFGKRRTLAIGAAFGVITVLGTKRQGQIEVATFRQDAAYSDGRHPDSVTYSTPEQDAQRRDFTINGLFYDPLNDRVIDFVGGQDDLQQRIVRAIGVPDDRIDEDKLRMLRAVRFAATYEFELDPETLSAVRRHAAELSVVSAERISDELRRMLGHTNRARAAELLRQSGLLTVVLPEVADIAADDEAWTRTLRILREIGTDGTFPAALAGMLREVRRARLPPSHGSAGASPSQEVAPQERRPPKKKPSQEEERSPGRLVGKLAARLRLSNDESRRTAFLLEHERTIRSARNIPWPELQPILIAGDAVELVAYCAAVAAVVDDDPADVEFCRAKLALPAKELNPPPLINGNDLQAGGIPPGKAYKTLLKAVRDSQLEGATTTRDDAMDLARKLWESLRNA